MSKDTAASERSGAVEYTSEEEKKFAQATIQTINDDLERREQQSIVFNGLTYSQSYEYNQRKAINYAPAKNKKDDREISAGIVHEKIVSFVAIFLKYIFKPHINAYLDGQLIPRMGDVYELGVKYSHKQEVLARKIALIYWELFSQGDAFVFEEWEVRNVTNPKPMLDGEPLDLDDMDYTYEFLEGLDYTEGEMVQLRRANSRVLDGRQVILGNPELHDGNQEQPRITIEEVMSRELAEEMFGSLTRWQYVPSTREELAAMGFSEKNTLFNSDRLKDPSKEVIVHWFYDKECNRYNFFINGVLMLPYKTPFTLFYPRNNYPLTQFCCERVTGSAYSRSIPAKTKFNADFLDWVLKKLALKFEQGIEPAIFAKGKYTLTRDMFRAGQVTHGVNPDDIAKADPDNKGLTQSEFGFFGLIKEIIEAQTVNQTTSGEMSANATATEIATVDQNQQKKLAFLLDAVILGYLDLYMRRCETIESKYTRAQGTTIVDGKEIKVYQDFSVSIAGVQNIVSFDERLQDEDFDVAGKKNELFKRSFDSKKENNPTEFYLVDPKIIRSGKLFLDMEVKPELMKDTQLQIIQMFDEFAQTLNLFGRSDQGGRVNVDEMQKEYLQVSGRSEDFFVSADLAQDPELQAALAQAGVPGAEGGTPSPYNKGSFGKPKISDALKSNMVGK